ncbi:MAG: DUF3549 family protein [Gammaproteobacteria bacterium]
MSDIQSLSDMLHASGLQYRVFDLGRRVVSLSQKLFGEIENGNKPYPYPLMQQAWLGVVFWDRDDKTRNAVWFVKLPLDEQALLIPAARDDFLRRVLDRRKNVDAGEVGDGPMAGALEDNPYAFRPADEVMAVFHAKATRVLGEGPSEFYDFTRAYLEDTEKGDWTVLGVQGIADVCARLDKHDNDALLADALAVMPVEPLAAFCRALESESIPLPVARALGERAGRAKDAPVMAACIRGLSYAQAAGLRDDIIGTLLSRDAGSHPDVLMAVSNRAWESLANERLTALFLERLAESGEGQDFFNTVVADLLYLPGMRGPLLKAIRDPDRSPAVSAAIGGLFKAYAR